MSSFSVIRFVAKQRLEGFILGIVILDLTLRFSDALQWSLEEKGTYGVSILLSLVWAYFFRNRLTPLFEHHKMLLGMLLMVTGGLSTFIYLGSYQFYFYFKTMPNLLSLQFIFRETEEFLSFMWADPLLLLFWGGAIVVFCGIWWHLIRLHTPHTQLRVNGVLLILLVVLLPIAHNNVHLTAGNVTPGVNVVFSLSKLLEKMVVTEDSSHGLYGRYLKPLPSLNQKLPFNVLLFVHETLRSRSCSFYGYPHPTTPQQAQFLLKDFPQRSFIFQYAFANSTTTQLSFPSILSGIHPGDSAQTLHGAPLFYEYGKMFLQTETFLLSSQSHKYGNFRNFLESDYLDTLWNKEIGKKPRFNNHGVDDKHLVPEFAALLEKVQQSNRHFFGVVQFNGTHYPHHVPETEKPAYSLGGGVAEKYDQSIHYVDHVVGQLFAQLNERGYLENTVIISTSDHGNGLGEHFGEFGHLKRFYNEGIQIPFWVYLPEELAHAYGAQLQENLQKSVQNIDIIPSLLYLLQIGNRPELEPYTSQLRGVNIFGEIPKNRNILIQNSNAYYTNLFKGIGVVQDNKKFLFNEDNHQISVEYYDIHADPLEQHNLWQEIRAEEQKQLLEGMWQDSLLRQWLPKPKRLFQGDKFF